jgi:hypothetical protein
MNFALTFFVLLALLGVSSIGYDKSKASVTPAAEIVNDTPDEFLLLHDGDSVRVLFRKDAGPGSIRYLSLSDTSRLDIIRHKVGVENYVFRKDDGWQTYPHDVADSFVTIILRETGDNVPAGGLPGCSDVVVRIENAAILSPDHTDGGGPGVRCDVCGAILDW